MIGSNEVAQRLSALAFAVEIAALEQLGLLLQHVEAAAVDVRTLEFYSHGSEVPLDEHDGEVTVYQDREAGGEEDVEPHGPFYEAS